MPRIHYDDRLSKCGDEQVGVSIPVPLNRRITELCAQADAAGAGAVARKEMLAAIVYEVLRRDDLDPADLVAAYRRADAHEVMPPRPTSQDHYEYDELRPGRNPRAA